MSFVGVQNPPVRPLSSADEMQARRALRRNRLLATGLLALMIVIAAATRVEPSPGWLVQLVRAGAEAGIIGGLADWFAITALFRHPHPGAGGNIGAIYAARAPADGYSLHFGAQSLAVNVTIAPQAGFDPVKDFEPIILVATAQDVLMVPPSSTFHSVKELIDFAKAHPGQLNYASLGPGTSAHLATALFSDLVGIKMQNVSYSAVSQASTDVMSGRVSLFIPTLGGHLGHIKAGNARALAVSGAVRAEQLPDVPTFKELGIPFVAETSWYGIYAPKGTPGKIVARVNKDVSQILKSPEVKKERGTRLQAARGVAGNAWRNAQERDRKMGEVG